MACADRRDKQKSGDWQGTLFPELHVENGN